MSEYTSSTPQYPDIHVRLTGEDGNAFLIIGRVASAIRRKHGAEAATEFTAGAQDSGSYDELLRYVMRTVEVY